jgi:hypothetical protein
MSKIKKYQNYKLYFIHGYESSPNGRKATLFRKKLNAIPVDYRDCKPEEIVINNCIKNILKIIENGDKVLIGSSLGGLLACKISLEVNIKQIILLNPSVIPPNIDINTIQGLPFRILKDMKDDRLFKNKINSKIFIIAGIYDELVPTDWILEFAKVQEATIKFLKDDHRLSKYFEHLPEIISDIIIS